MYCCVIIVDKMSNSSSHEHRDYRHHHHHQQQPAENSKPVDEVVITSKPLSIPASSQGEAMPKRRPITGAASSTNSASESRWLSEAWTMRQCYDARRKHRGMEISVIAMASYAAETVLQTSIVLATLPRHCRLPCIKWRVEYYTQLMLKYALDNFCW